LSHLFKSLFKFETIELNYFWLELKALVFVCCEGRSKPCCPWRQSTWAILRQLECIQIKT